MLLEKPTEADAVSFRSAIEELQSVFDKFDSLNKLETERSEQFSKNSLSLQKPELIVVADKAGAQNHLDVPQN